MEKINKKDSKLNLFVIIAVLIIFTALFFKYLYSLSITDTLFWFAGVFILFYIPGSLILKWLSFSHSEYSERIFHSTALGAALMPLPYGLFRGISYPQLIYIFVGALFFIWLFLGIKKIKQTVKNLVISYPELASVLFMLSVVFLLLHLTHFTDVGFFEDGFKLRISSYTEADFHLGIINSFKNIFPPSFIYASGTEHFPYHLNMYFEIEMFNRLLNIETMKLVYFYFPLLYFGLLVFIPYVFVREIGGKRSIAVLTGLIIFGSDFSFIPGMLNFQPSTFPWTIYFTTTIWSLFTLNGILPAVFVMGLCFIHIKRFYENRSLKYLIIFGLLVFSAYGFKSSMGFHIAGALLLAVIVFVMKTRDKKFGLSLLITILFVVMMMALDLLIFKSGRGNYVLDFNMFGQLKNSFTRIGIENGSLLLFLLTFPIYTIATFGFRSIGFLIFKDTLIRKKLDFNTVFIVVFSLSGFALSEVLYIGISGGQINNAVWFGVQSLIASCFLMPYFLIKKQQSTKKLFILITVIFFLAIPSTIQFLTLRYSSNYRVFGKNAIEVIQYLEKTPSNSIFLYPPNFNEPSLASNFAGRFSVYSIYHSFVSQNLGLTEARDRFKSITLFFKTDNTEIRKLILRKYKVDYVYAPLNYIDQFEKEPFLKMVLKNNEYVIYRVSI